MNLTAVKIFQYALPLTKPLTVKGKNLDKREGIFIQIFNEQQMTGAGEISPLPCLSSETLTDAIKQLQSIKPKLLNQSIPAKVEHLNGRFEKWLGPFKLYPSVRFGLEMAVLNLIAQERKTSVSHLINKNAHADVFVNGLLTGTKNEVLKEARELLQNGFTAFKLKVGRGSVESDIEKIKALNELMRDKALLRLDANQAWALKSAIQLGEKIGCAAVEYIEEPLKSIGAIPEFYARTLIPVALDESLLVINTRNIKYIDGVDVIVFKPTMFGSIEKAWALIKQSQNLGMKVVISSSYETSLGIIFLAHLSACLLRETPVGLDTLKFFKNDLLTDKVKIKHGKLNLKDLNFRLEDINYSFAKEV